MTFVGVGLIFVLGLIMLASDETRKISSAKTRTSTDQDALNEALDAAASRAVAETLHDIEHHDHCDPDDHTSGVDHDWDDD